MRNAIIHFLLIIILSLGCKKTSSETQDEYFDDTKGMSTETMEDWPVLALHCEGESNLKPQTIFEFVDLVNRQPKPLTIPCLVHALAKPLQLLATDSRMSVQPAQGRERPRIFLRYENLLLSFVPGEAELELGEIFQETLSIKAELKFPLTEEIGLDAPFLTVGPMSNGGKRCGTYCHKNVIELEPVGEAMIYASQIIRPNPLTEVSIEELHQHAGECRDAQDEACLLYQAIFIPEMPQPFSFDPGLPSF